ncbi:MAG: hypothetical protein KDA78_11885, partial [Planctomycetaceae bacterium]|nr:hypothetical protein [Planctomycetaceae bacterium]
MLASSVSGGIQSRSDRNESAKAASGQDFRQTLEQIAAKETQDVGETTLDTERDADGRSTWAFSAHPDEDTENGPSAERRQKPRPLSINPDEHLGQHLDLNG